jgi:beta-glucosidase-like glycosyl hydrolase
LEEEPKVLETQVAKAFDEEFDGVPGELPAMDRPSKPGHEIPAPFAFDERVGKVGRCGRRVVVAPGGIGLGHAV